MTKAEVTTTRPGLHFPAILATMGLVLFDYAAEDAALRTWHG
jgi:hypothetical protein